MKRVTKSEKILTLISSRTAKNPIYSKEIERKLSVKDGTIRDAIRKARRKGILIGNCDDRFSHKNRKNSKGYFLAKNKKEMEATMRDLRGRRNSLVETIEALEFRLEKK
jgi:Mn-dependent DtxR family transcriptional regulator